MYRQLLRGQLKALGHYADDLLSAKTDFEFFYGIAHYVMPLIKSSDAFCEVLKLYEKGKEAYFKRYTQLKESLFIEEEKVCESLIMLLESDDLSFNDEKIKAHLLSIKNTILRRKRHAILQYDGEISRQLYCVLEELFELGLVNVVKQYASITLPDEHLQNTEGSREEIRKPFIKRFTCIPSLPQLYELNATWDERKVLYSWVSWEWLSLIEWCWNTPFSFFSEARDEIASLPLLILHSYWVELDRIKRQDAPNLSVFLNRALFQKYLHSVVNSVLLIQMRGALGATFVEEDEDDIDNLYSCELRVDERYGVLLFVVIWVQGGYSTDYLFYRFRSDGGGNSGPLNFMIALFKAPGTVIDVNKVCGVSGATVTKYLSWLKIKKSVIGRNFFDKATTYTIMLKTKIIYGKDLSRADKKELCALIETLAVFSE